MNQKTPAEEKLVVKELADSLGVSTRFIYQMRRCGFPMHGHTKDNQTATTTEAVRWIEANDFRLCNGVGLTKNSIGSLP